jgi:DNA ligase-1
VVRTLRQIAAAEGQGSQGRKLELLAGLLGQATPLEARYLLRLVTGNLRLGIGTPTILDALAQVYAGGRAQRKVLERGYNICCDIGLVASTLVSGGLAAVEKLHVQAGNPVRAMLAQRLSDAAEILAKLGGRCSAEYKYDGVRVQAHRLAAAGRDQPAVPGRGRGAEGRAGTPRGDPRRGGRGVRRGHR